MTLTKQQIQTAKVLLKLKGPDDGPIAAVRYLVKQLGPLTFKQMHVRVVGQDVHIFHIHTYNIEPSGQYILQDGPAHCNDILHYFNVTQFDWTNELELDQ